MKAYIGGQAATVSMDRLPWAKIQVYTQFPREDLNGAECMAVTGLYLRPEKRFRGPRGQGTKELSYRLNLLLQTSHKDPQVGGDGFDTLVERMLWVFRAPLAGQVPLVDPVDGQSSTLTHIGEDIQVQAMMPTDPDLALVTFKVIITLPLTELISPA